MGDQQVRNAILMDESTGAVWTGTEFKLTADLEEAQRFTPADGLRAAFALAHSHREELAGGPIEIHRYHANFDESYRAINTDQARSWPVAEAAFKRTFDVQLDRTEYLESRNTTKAHDDAARPREAEREQRMSALVNTALEMRADGDRDQAEIWAYEAGRFGLPMPERLAQHQELAASFQRGQRDVVQDAADAERADAVAEVVNAVGERNATAIQGADAAKGEDLKYEVGLSPAATKTAREADAETNVIEHTPDRQRGAEPIDLDEALATAAKLRKRDREAYEAERSDIEANRTRMQDRSEAEQHRVKQLDGEARRLDKQNDLGELAGVDGNYGRQAVTEAEKMRRIEIMEQVNTQFRVSGPRHYFKDQPDRIAFRDNGDQLKSASNDQRVARAMAMMADAKGWKTITVSGHPDFRREVWFEASLRGLEVKGYKPDERDLQALASYQERKMENVVERGPEKVQSRTERQPLQETRSERSESRSEPQKDTTPPTARNAQEKAPTGSLRANEGIVLAHGPAPFNNDPQEKPSYFVTLATPTGEKTKWGKDLERAMSESGAGKGDAVRLEFKGSEQVTVEALKRDEKGKIIGTENIQTNRNTWEVHRSDREKVVAAVAAAVVANKVKDPANRETVMKLMNERIRERAEKGTLPPVMMFDKSAPSRTAEKERARPVVERNAERTR